MHRHKHGNAYITHRHIHAKIYKHARHSPLQMGDSHAAHQRSVHSHQLSPPPPPPTFPTQQLLPMTDSQRKCLERLTATLCPGSGRHGGRSRNHPSSPMYPPIPLCSPPIPPYTYLFSHAPTHSPTHHTYSPMHLPIPLHPPIPLCTYLCIHAPTYSPMHPPFPPCTHPPPSMPSGKMSRVLSLESRLQELVDKPLRTVVDRNSLRGDPEVCVCVCVCVCSCVFIPFRAMHA